MPAQKTMWPLSADICYSLFSKQSKDIFVSTDQLKRNIFLNMETLIKKILVGWLSILSSAIYAGDSLYVRKITDTLASKAFMGRGYIQDGMKQAGNFIAGEMKSIGLGVENQSFTYPVNTFPGEMLLTVNGIALQAGKQFIVSPESKNANAIGTLIQADSITWVNQEKRIIIKLVDKLTWSVAREQADYTAFNVLKTAVLAPADFTCRVNADFKKKFTCDNIIGTIKGNKQPDSVILFTAHYDHLGAMGKDTWFPGANDNAGGVAMMLDLARYFVANPPAYTIQFIAFAGEEAGLVGSKYYAENPLTNLQKIKFLTNLDLVGNGDEGITVVNATEFPRAFTLLQDINTSQHLLVAVNSRGKAANSDHYWFTEKGVPSFFIYTLGKRKAYHDVDDMASTVPWYEVNDLEQLLIAFTNAMATYKEHSH